MSRRFLLSQISWHSNSGEILIECVSRNVKVTKTSASTLAFTRSCVIFTWPSSRSLSWLGSSHSSSCRRSGWEHCPWLSADISRLRGVNRSGRSYSRRNVARKWTAGSVGWCRVGRKRLHMSLSGLTRCERSRAESRQNASSWAWWRLINLDQQTYILIISTQGYINVTNPNVKSTNWCNLDYPIGVLSSQVLL